MMRTVAAALPVELSDDEALGTTIAAAVYACYGGRAPEGERGTAEGEGGTAEGGTAEGEGGTAEGGTAEGGTAEGGAAEGGAAEGALDVDAAAAADATLAQAEVARACDGLCSSNELRQAAETPLYCVNLLLAPPKAQGQHALFAAAAATPGETPRTATEFAALVHMWDTLKLEKEMAGKRAPGYLADFIVAMAASRSTPESAADLRTYLALLRVDGPPISGKCLPPPTTLPPHLRGAFISQLHVLCRLRKSKQPLQSPEELVDFLKHGCGGLLELLEAEWYAPEGSEQNRELRPEYANAPPSAGRYASARLRKKK